MTSHVRFCHNNFAQVSYCTITASSEVAGFEAVNVVDTRRFKKWMAAGQFEVTTANQTIYINDGSNKTVTLTVGTYATGALLAAHIQTQLNASSTLWTCVYSSTTGKFTIGRSSGTALLRLTVTTNAAWSMLGYVGVIDDDVGTGQAADERRNHTSEWLKFVFTSAVAPTGFLAAAGAVEDFGWDPDTVITIKMNNVDSWTAAPVSITGTVEQLGVAEFFDDVGSTLYTHFKVELVNTTSEDGPNFVINQVFLGTYVTPITRDLNLGFQRILVDPSEKFTTDNGTRYARRKQKYWRYQSMQVDNISDSDRTELERVITELGATTQFWVSIDPAAAISESTVEFTKYVEFEGELPISNIFYRYFGVSMNCLEVV